MKKTGLYLIELIQIPILSANTAIGRRRTAICLKVKNGAYSSTQVLVSAIFPMK